jgi:hypothetical protein
MVPTMVWSAEGPSRTLRTSSMVTPTTLNNSC